MITIELHPVVGYPARTIENAAKSDLTLAVASDFSTPGEKLTAKVARNKILQIPHQAQDFDAQVAKLVDRLNVVADSMFDADGDGLVLNCAGNGVWQLPGAMQKNADDYAHALLSQALSSPARRFKLSLVRSGGQSGYDVAFLKAADKLGVPALAHVAKSLDGKFLVRLSDGKDRSMTIEEYRMAMGM